MRADRLLSMLLLLQSKERVTAEMLAQELEVSERTVYRDIDALSMAGIPIYTQPGTNGGIFLDEQYRVSLTGLSQNQVLALFSSGETSAMADLGLSRANKDSLLKLFSILPSSHQQAVEDYRQRIHIDPVGWFSVSETSNFFEMLQQAVWSDQQVDITYQAIGQDSYSVRLCAIGLVFKADKWYLVGRKESGDYRIYRLTRFQDLQILESTFERDPSFDLADFWGQSRHYFEQSMRDSYPAMEVVLRVHPELWWYVEQVFLGRFEPMSEPDDLGWVNVKIYFRTPLEAQTHTLAMGRRAIIMSPIDLRESVIELARNAIQHHQS